MNTEARFLTRDYPQLVETLLAGRVICPHATPTLHRLLVGGAENPDVSSASQDGPSADRGATAERQEVELVLETLGRHLVAIGGGFYAAYARDDAATEAAITERFKAYTRDTPFLVSVFDLLREARPGGEAFAAGDRIVFSSSNDQIMRNQALSERLHIAVRHVSHAKSAYSTEQALRRIVNKLVDMGYLHPLYGSDQDYVVTAELTLFDSFRDFVASVMDLDLDETASEDERSGQSQSDLTL